MNTWLSYLGEETLLIRGGVDFFEPRHLSDVDQLVNERLQCEMAKAQYWGRELNDTTNILFNNCVC